jgi:MFS family permease
MSSKAEFNPMHEATAAVQTKDRATTSGLTTKLFLVSVFLYWAALYLYVPTLPTYVESKSANLAMVGIVLSQYGLWQALIRLPLGIVSDWFGKRKPFIAAGLLLAGVGAVWMGMANGVTGLLLGRAVTGLAAGTWVPLVVLFSSLYPSEESVRASSLLTLIGTLGRVLATGITGYLNNLGGYALAFFGAAVAAALAILVVLPTHEQPRAPRPPSLVSVGNLIARRDVLLPSLLSALSQYANWAATFGFVPILASQLGASGVIQSFLMSLNLVMMTLGNLLATTLSRRTGAQRLVYAGFVLLFIGVGGAALAPSLPLLFAAQWCIGLAQGISYPVLMGLSIRHVDEAQRTSAMGLHQAVYAIGMFAGPAVSGWLADAIGIRPMLGVTAWVVLGLGIIATRWLHERT